MPQPSSIACQHLHRLSLPFLVVQRPSIYRSRSRRTRGNAQNNVASNFKLQTLTTPSLMMMTCVVVGGCVNTVPSCGGKNGACLPILAACFMGPRAGIERAPNAILLLPTRHIIVYAWAPHLPFLRPPSLPPSPIERIICGIETTQQRTLTILPAVPTHHKQETAWVVFPLVHMARAST